MRTVSDWPRDIMASAVVTGASGGIGQAVVSAFKSRGWNVICQRNRNTDPDLQGSAWIAADFEQPGAVDAIEIWIRERGVSIRVLVHCAAAICTGTPLGFEECDRLARVNLIAPYRLAESLARHMEPGGAMFFISSVAARKASPGAEFYGATKAGVNSLVSALAYRFGPAGIRVYGICPGVIATEMSRPIWECPQKRSMLIRANPFQRLGRPADVANLIVALASPRCRWATGLIVDADGGSFLGFGDDVWREDGSLVDGFLKRDAKT